MVPCDCILMCNADTTLEYETEPSLEVFQQVTIYSCVKVIVRITDDIPLLNWISHFTRRFLNKMRSGRGWKESIAQFGEEELTSLVKRIIQGVFVGHHDRTIVHLTRSGIVSGYQLEGQKSCLIQRNLEQTFHVGAMRWKVMRRKGVANLQTNRLNSCTKSQLHVLSTINSKKKKIGSGGELSKVYGQIVIKCLYFARIGRPDKVMVSK